MSKEVMLGGKKIPYRCDHSRVEPLATGRQDTGRLWQGSDHGCVPATLHDSTWRNSWLEEAE